MNATGRYALVGVVSMLLAVPVVAQSPDAETAPESLDAGSGPESGDSPSNGASTPASERAGRGRVLTIRQDGFRATLRRPTGWIVAEGASGSVVTLRAASDRTAEVEVRLSTPVTSEKRASFFNSFHSKLKTAGFVALEDPSKQTFGSTEGRRVEYKGHSDRGEFRLAVWQFHRNDAAWIVSGFFPTERRSRHYRAFVTVCESLSVEPVDGSSSDAGN